jgi:rhodanese-related sulfurtransferase
MAMDETIPEVDAAGADTMAAAGAVLLDVRQPEEWAAGHAAAAVHVPMGEVPAACGDWSTDRRIVCICRSGNRSGRVVQYLRALGFDAVNVAGGMIGWADSGRPVVDDAGRSGSVV